MIFVSEFLRDQILSGSDKVVKHVLFFVQHAGAVPLFAKFVATAKLDVSIDAALLQQYQHGIAVEEWSASQVEAAIAGEHCRIFSIQCQSFFVNNEQWDPSAVF